MEKQGVIYKIENTVNGKLYFGQTRQDFQKRKGAHLSALRKSKHHNGFLQNAFNKYGEQAFKFEIVERCSVEELNTAEEFWIDLYDTMNSELGYNLASGGGVGTVMHESTRAKIRDFVTKRNMRGRQVLCVDDNVIFKSTSEAAEYFSVHKSCVTRACYNRKNSVRGKKFAFIEISPEGDVTVFNRKIIELNSGKVFMSEEDAMLYFGIEKSYISSMCKGTLKLTEGALNFKYYDEHMSN